MDLTLERMYHVGQPRPLKGQGFGGIYENGYYINYLHGLDFFCRKHIQKNTKVLELGCFYGASSELFREYSDFVTSVDLVLHKEMEEVINRCGINFIKSDSIEFLENINIGEYDVIYIDTTHDFGRTKNEILSSYNKMVNGQIISGHNYNSHGVYNAVMDVFEYPDIEIYLDSSWAIEKTDKLKLKSNVSYTNNFSSGIPYKDNFSSEDTPCFVKNYHQNEDANFYIYEKCYISDVIRKNQIWEPFMHDVFEKYITKDSVVIEGGCHIGTHSVKLSKLSKKLYCFEPLPSSNELLKKNLQLNNCNNVDVFNCGLSDNFEIADFGWIQSNNPGASFLNNNPMGLPDNSHNYNQNSKVNLITINSLNLDKLDFIKLDVEGYEPKVINGGINTIKKLKPIIILECWSNHNSGADPIHTEETFSILFEIGYRMERISHSDWLFIPEAK